jgi:flagellar biogenesis protein FliO
MSAPSQAVSLLTAILALLAVVAGLFLLQRLATRGLGQRLASRLGAGATTRLAVEERLVLDARRRVVLVRVDGARSVLLLIGGPGADAVLGWVEDRA